MPKALAILLSLASGLLPSCAPEQPVRLGRPSVLLTRRLDSLNLCRQEARRLGRPVASLENEYARANDSLHLYRAGTLPDTAPFGTSPQPPHPARSSPRLLQHGGPLLVDWLVTALCAAALVAGIGVTASVLRRPAARPGVSRVGAPRRRKPGPASQTKAEEGAERPPKAQAGPRQPIYRRIPQVAPAPAKAPRAGVSARPKEAGSGKGADPAAGRPPAHAATAAAPQAARTAGTPGGAQSPPLQKWAKPLPVAQKRPRPAEEAADVPPRPPARPSTPPKASQHSPRPAAAEPEPAAGRTAVAQPATARREPARRTHVPLIAPAPDAGAPEPAGTANGDAPAGDKPRGGGRTAAAGTPSPEPRPHTAKGAAEEADGKPEAVSVESIKQQVLRAAAGKRSAEQIAGELGLSVDHVRLILKTAGSQRG